VTERLRVAVRPRPPWEAADLGLALLRDQARPAARVWLATALPLAAVLVLACASRPWLAPLAFWWLLPLLDRPLLHVLARGTFGEATGLARTLREAPGYARRGLAATLLWRRFSPERALLLPVWQLEQPSGAGFRARRKVLLARGGTHARLVSLVWLGFAGALSLGFVAGLDFFGPRGAGTGLLSRAFSAPRGAAPWPGILLSALATLALAAMEPFHLASGFGLYLNRRVQLEAWDLELAFRDLAARIRRRAPRGPAALLAPLLVGVLLLGLAPRLAAQPAAPAPSAAPASTASPAAGSAPKAALQEVLTAPEFSAREKVWRLKPRSRPQPRRATVSLNWLEPVAAALKLLLLGAVAFTIGYLLWSHRHGLRQAFARSPEPAADPSGASAARTPAAWTPAPADLAGAAQAIWDQGDPRGALGLLYRGALAWLGQGTSPGPGPRLPLGEATTEAECLRLAAELPQAGYLARLVGAWQAAAYAGQAPDPADRSLCAEWAAQFRGPGRRP
jgi:hypothetical protein